MLFSKTLILKALRLKKNNYFKAGIKVLDSLMHLIPKFVDSQKPDTMHYLVKVYLTYQSLYLALHDYEKAIENGRKGIEMIMKELTLRFQK